MTSNEHDGGQNALFNNLIRNISHGVEAVGVTLVFLYCNICMNKFTVLLLCRFEQMKYLPIKKPRRLNLLNTDWISALPVYSPYNPAMAEHAYVSLAAAVALVTPQR